MVSLLMTTLLSTLSAKIKTHSLAKLPVVNPESKFNRRRRQSQPSLKWIFTIYLFVVIALRPKRPWNYLTENSVVGFALTIFDLPQAIMENVKSPPSNWDQKFIDFITDRIAAPQADLSSTPHAYLKSRIRHVVIIGLESIHANVLPFSADFVTAIKDELLNENLTSDDITPFWNSLMPKSLVMTNASTTSSFTMKSLLTTYCEVWPMNVDYLDECLPYRHYYQKCLPELVRDFFPDWEGPKCNASSGFNIGFFQTAAAKFSRQD